MNNVHITESFKIGKKDFKNTLDTRKQQAYQFNKEDEIPVFENRSYYSMKNEWACHNLLYVLNIARTHTCDVDLNYPQKWYAKAAYFIFGPISLLLIK